MWSGGVGKVGFEHGYTIRSYRLVGIFVGGDFKYFVLISLLLFGETDMVIVVAGPRWKARGVILALRASIYFFTLIQVNLLEYYFVI